MTPFFKEYFDRTTFFACLALIAIGLLSIYSATFDTNAASSFTSKSCGVSRIRLDGRGDVHSAARHSALFDGHVCRFTCCPCRGSCRRSSSVRFTKLVWLWRNGRSALRVCEDNNHPCTSIVLQQERYEHGNIKDVGIAFAILLLPISLIMMQPDLGTSLTFVAMFIPVLYWAGASNFLIVAIIAPGVVALAAIIGTTTFLVVLTAVGALLYFFREDRFFSALMFGVNAMVGIFVQVAYEKLPMYQQKRISTFLDPNNDPLGAGYNVIQAKVAIGSGGFLGKGYLQGTQTQLNFIPKQWTDFIFCVPGEEFGFLGAIVVVALFAVILIHGIRVGYVVKNKFGSTVAIGIVSLFAVHVLSTSACRLD